jgi:release factor glutamine methyltransferase
MSISNKTIKAIRLYLSKELNEIYKEPEINAIANIIIKTIIGVTRLHQLYMPEYDVSRDQYEKIMNICEELKTGKPVQYILGETIFYDCTIRVTEATLIPRPETEELVDLIIKENKGYTGTLIDIGTGSGCIAIALSLKLPEAIITGIDISDEALLIAKENATLNKTSVTFIKRDILNIDYETINKAGIIVSNPPYVRKSEKIYMNRNVLDFEPHIALFVEDSDPLVFYRAILKLAEKILLPGGKVYFEINEALGKSMTDLFELFGYSGIEIVADINGKDRIIKGKKDV